jgi:L-lactate dehydrogenase complex protein LldE
VTQERKQECCGFGGTFALKQGDISGAMVQDKTDSLRATGAERVVSQDCGCLMNIGGALEKQGAGPATQHIAEFLLERCHASE